MIETQEDGSRSDVLDELTEEDSSTKSLEDLLWEKTEELSHAEEHRLEIEKKIQEVEISLQNAQEAYEKADSIAAAAMEAAEEAVRDEMDYITVANETESAMLKAMEDLKYFDDSSERREEEFDKKRNLQQLLRSRHKQKDTETQASSSTDTKQTKQVAQTKKADALASIDSSEESMSPGKKQALIYLLHRSWQKHRLVIAAAAVSCVFAAVLLSQEHVAMAVSQTLVLLLKSCLRYGVLELRLWKRFLFLMFMRAKQAFWRPFGCCLLQ
eukprot:jgi/Picre1/32688/NNA_008033.t1